MPTPPSQPRRMGYIGRSNKVWVRATSGRSPMVTDCLSPPPTTHTFPPTVVIGRSPHGIQLILAQLPSEMEPLSVQGGGSRRQAIHIPPWTALDGLAGRILDRYLAGARLHSLMTLLCWLEIPE